VGETESAISIDYLRQRLRYEPETGKLYWLGYEDMPRRWLTRYSGREAFTTQHSKGYKTGYVDTATLFAHRVAWALYYGGWPTKQIDHINGVRHDNKISNLRVVSCQENNRNAKRREDNTSSVCGVYRKKSGGRWVAQIKVYGKQKYLGCFDTLEEATKVRKEAEVKYEFHENHGRD
jgi:hypothetical protein